MKLAEIAENKCERIMEQLWKCGILQVKISSPSELLRSEIDSASEDHVESCANKLSRNE